MAETISDYTFNPWRVKGDNRIVLSESVWHEPVVWNRKAGEGACRSCGGRGAPLVRINDRKRVRSEFACEACYGTCEGKPYRARVFCASLADVFEDWTGPMLDAKGNRLVASPIFGNRPGDWLTMQDVRDRLFRLIDATPHLDWLVLTKRPENIERMMPGISGTGDFGRDDVCTYSVGPRPNLWLGTSIENLATRERIDELRTIPAAIRFLSIEPLLEDIGTLDLTGIDLVIAGGESGPKARPCDVAWIRSIRDQCKAAGTAFFLKQLGARCFSEKEHDFLSCRRIAEKGSLIQPGETERWKLMTSDQKGGSMDEWPADMRVREMPRCTSTTNR